MSNLWQKGFRPFFLLAIVHAVLFIPLWVFVLRGTVAFPPYLDPASLHAHEMLFGFAFAAVAGFLLTAVTAWTGRDTAVGRPLAALAACWLGARVALFAGLPGFVVAALDLATIGGVAVAIGRPLIATGNRRNYQFIGFLAVLGFAALLVHLDAAGITPGLRFRAHRLALCAILMIVAAISGRIVPMFTRNATGVTSITPQPMADHVTVVGLGLLGIAEMLGLHGVPIAAAALLAAGGATVRTLRWGPEHSLSNSLLWVMHVGHAWLPIGLVLRALSALFPSIPQSAAWHALGMGVVGTLVIGILPRVTLGHTGRPLRPNRTLTIAFAAQATGAAVRVIGPFLPVAALRGSYDLAGTLWLIGFALIAKEVGPMLLAPRVDGQPG